MKIRPRQTVKIIRTEKQRHNEAHRENDTDTISRELCSFTDSQIEADVITCSLPDVLTAEQTPAELHTTDPSVRQEAVKRKVEFFVH